MTSKFAKISKKRWWSPQFAINDFFCCFFLMLQIAQTTLSIIFLYVFMFILKRTWIKVFEICYTEYFENYVHQVTFSVESLRSQTPKEYFYNKETASNLLIPLCNIFENVTRVYSTPTSTPSLSEMLWRYCKLA